MVLRAHHSLFCYNYPMNPEKHNQDSRKVPRDPAHHTENPPNNFEGKFNDPENPQKPFERLYDYVQALKSIKGIVKKGEAAYFDYIDKNPIMMPDRYLDLIGTKDEEMKSDLMVEFMKHPGSLDELSDIVLLINDPGDFRAVPVAIANLEKFLNRD